jgi:hypothetical protein
MMNINIFDTDIFPYLEGEALKGSTLTLTIRDIKVEEMKSHKGKKEEKHVLYFRENAKGFVLNKTNAKRIAQMYGPTTGGWEGKPITLYTEEVQAFGETHNALRVAVERIHNGTPTNGDMSLDKLFAKLRMPHDFPGMNTFYGKPEDILACRAKGAPLPAADDIEGWRNLYKDARDYAIDRINEAVERGDVSPDQIPMTEATAVEAAEKMDIDKVDEDKRADELWAALNQTEARQR